MTLNWMNILVSHHDTPSLERLYLRDMLYTVEDR